MESTVNSKVETVLNTENCLQFEPIEKNLFCGRNNGFNYTMVTPENLLTEWQQNHRAPWLSGSAKITVQIWLT